jgi:hypothetical protein
MHQLRTRDSCCKGCYIGSARESALCVLVEASLEYDVNCLWRDIRYGVMKVSAFRRAPVNAQSSAKTQIAGYSANVYRSTTVFSSICA